MKLLRSVILVACAVLLLISAISASLALKPEGVDARLALVAVESALVAIGAAVVR